MLKAMVLQLSSSLELGLADLAAVLWLNLGRAQQLVDAVLDLAAAAVVVVGLCLCLVLLLLLLLVVVRLQVLPKRPRFLECPAAAAHLMLLLLVLLLPAAAVALSVLWLVPPPMRSEVGRAVEDLVALRTTVLHMDNHRTPKKRTEKR